MGLSLSLEYRLLGPLGWVPENKSQEASLREFAFLDLARYFVGLSLDS